MIVSLIYLREHFTSDYAILMSQISTGCYSLIGLRLVVVRLHLETLDASSKKCITLRSYGLISNGSPV